MTTYIITLINGWTVVTSDRRFLREMDDGFPFVTVTGNSRTYHIPTTSIVCVQEADE